MKFHEASIELMLAGSLLAVCFFLASFLSMYEVVCVSGILRSGLSLFSIKKMQKEKPLLAEFHGMEFQRVNLHEIFNLEYLRKGNGQ